MLKCNHVPFLTKPDNFVGCRLCSEIWWDSLAYERDGAVPPTKTPTAKAIAKAVSEGGARQANFLGRTERATSKPSYYET